MILQRLIESDLSVSSIIEKSLIEDMIGLQQLVQEIEKERDNLYDALSKAYDNPDLWVKLYSAKQALEWVLKPLIADSPLDTILRGQVVPPPKN